MKLTLLPLLSLVIYLDRPVRLLGGVDGGSDIFTGHHHPSTIQNVTSLCGSIDKCGSLYSRDYVKDVYYSGLRKRLVKAKTKECRSRIEYEYVSYLRSLAEESPFHFETIWYQTQCPNVIDSPQLPVQRNGIQQLGKADASIPVMPLRNDSVDPSVLSIVYIVLVHENPDFVVRILDALDEPMHSFVIHVDASANPVHAVLRRRLKHRTNIHFLNTDRERISWGGFSIVNATLKCMRYAWDQHLHFDYMVDISGTHYPIKSNYYIRKMFSSNLNTIYIETYPLVARPDAQLWQRFVECDGALHRIARIPIIKGINMVVGSQWWAFPTYFVHWLLTNPLAKDYIQYAQYIIIADENYFATMFYNSPYCTSELVKTMNFLLFDKWEHEREYSERPKDDRKCLGITPKNCGRSPSTLTSEFTDLIISSRSVYARKFNPKNSSSLALVDYIDSMRGTHSKEYTEAIENWDNNKGDQPSVSTMIRLGNEHLLLQENNHHSSGISNSTNASSAELGSQHHHQCITFPPKGGDGAYLTFQKCDPSNEYQWIEIGRCSPGYELVLSDHTCPSFRKSNNSSTSATTSSTEGEEEEANVFCSLFKPLKDMDICFDISGETPRPDVNLIGYKCTGKWNQIYKLSDNCTITAEQPGLIGRVRGFGDEAISFCLTGGGKQNYVSTAQCEHEKIKKKTMKMNEDTTTTTATTAAVAVAQSNASREVVTAMDGSIVNSAAVAEVVISSKVYVYRQQFEFMPISGNAYKKYGAIRDKV